VQRDFPCLERQSCSGHLLLATEQSLLEEHSTLGLRPYFSIQLLVTLRGSMSGIGLACVTANRQLNAIINSVKKRIIV